jgi:hypothetical protein
MPSLEDLTTDQLLEVAKRTKRSDDLLGALLRDKETREITLRGLKKVDPSMQIPEIDAADAVRTDLEKLREENKALEDRLRNKEITDTIREDQRRVKEKFGLTDADLLEVQKIMTDKEQPIPYWDRAAQFYLAQQRVAEPSPSTIQPPIYEMPEKDVWGKGIGNKSLLDKIAIDEAYKALNEVMGGKVAGGR